MNLKLILAGLFVFLSCACMAQDDEFLIEEEPTDKYQLKDHLVLDMNFLLQFGTVTTLGANPQLGYRVTPRITAGAGYNYIQQSVLINNFGDRVKDKFIGPTVFGSVMVYEGYFIRTDYQWLTLLLDNGTSIPSEFLLDRWLIGVGNRNIVSRKLAISGGIYIDVKSPVLQPVFRTGIEYSFGGWD